jgi:PAS domain S-box-containing protein
MSTQDSVYITDLEGTIVFVNKAFCRTYGYSEEEIVGQNGNVLWIAKRQSKSTRSVFQTKTVGSNYEVGFYHRRKDDSVFPVSLSRAPVKDSGGHDVAIVAVARDITDRVLVEDEIRTASLKLKQRIRLQNEVAILVGEAVQELLVDGRIETAQKVVADHLDMAKLDAGRLELNRQRFDLAALISEVAEQLQPTLAQQQVDLENATPADQCEINADRSRVAQVFGGLLRRAIESSPPNGLVSVEIKDADDEFTVAIHDDGAPLESAEIHRIVNRSDWIQEQFQAGREETALNLRLAKELIELDGGRMWTESTDAKRNTLCFTLSKSGVRLPQNVRAEMSSARAD